LEAQAKESGDARIVNHSSGGRLNTPNNGLEQKYFEKNGDNLGGDEMQLFSGPCFYRYFQTKLANSVFTYGLHNKLQAKGSKVRAVSAHPGVSDTNLGDLLKFGYFTDMMLNMMIPFLVQTPEDGAMGIIHHWAS
jgi:NAD(P)-dependent dehydrogenase (short-subunit alcohol dehydrogenase family)